MKKLLFSLSVTAAAFSISAQTAPNFTANDCLGNNHDLYTELNSGKIIVITWVMPCNSCINGAKFAQNAVNSFSTSNPGTVLHYVADDYGNTSCTTLLNWLNTNNVTPNARFSDAGVNMTGYGTAGMPKVVVLGGTDHTIYYNVNNSSVNQANITTAINNALAIVGNAQTYSISPAKTVTFTAPFNNVTINDIYMVNTGTTSLSITWELISVNVPTGWDYSMCDLGTCYPGIPAGPTTMNTANVGGSDPFLGLNIDPQNIAGTGTVVVRVYKTGSSSNADTLTWKITANAVSVEEIYDNSGIRIFPSPVIGTLTVDLSNLEVKSANMTDVFGRKVMNLSLNSSINSIDVSALTKGFYMLNLETADKHLFKRVIVE